MPVSGLSAAGASPVVGGTDAITTTLTSITAIVGAPGVQAVQVVQETGYYEIWAEGWVTVQPAGRWVALFLQRGPTAAGVNLEEAVLRADVPAWQSRVYGTWLNAGDIVRATTDAGAIGDFGQVLVHTRRAGK